MSGTGAERLAAGLAADERIADGLSFACKIPDRVPDFTGAGGPAAEQFWNRFTPHRRAREVARDRAILALYEEFAAKRDERTAHPKYAVDMCCEVLDQVVAALASVYTETGAPAAASGGEPERTRMWRDLVEDRGIDRANRDWPALDPGRGGPGYARARLSSHHAHPTGANWAATSRQATNTRDNEDSKPGRAATAAKEKPNGRMSAWL